MRYQGIADAASRRADVTRTDNYITLELRVDYPFKDWLIAQRRLRPAVQHTEPHARRSRRRRRELVPLDYMKHEV